MEYKILDAILEAHEAEEIAQDCRLSSEEEGAALWFNEIYYESTWRMDKMPKYSQFVKKIEGGNLYYDYGANYYFLVQENNVNESKNKKNTIRLTESDLKRVISESVKNILKELNASTYYNAARKRYQQANYGGNGRANNPEIVSKGNQLSKYANDMFQKQYGVSVYDVSNPNWRNNNPGHPAIKAWMEMQGN